MGNLIKKVTVIRNDKHNFPDKCSSVAA